MKVYGGMEVLIQAFFTSALDGGQWSVSRPGSFKPRERAPGTHRAEGWVSLRASPDVVEKINFFD
jgi:hypothetical protein